MLSRYYITWNTTLPHTDTNFTQGNTNQDLSILTVFCYNYWCLSSVYVQFLFAIFSTRLLWPLTNFNCQTMESLYEHTTHRNSGRWRMTWWAPCLPLLLCRKWLLCPRYTQMPRFSCPVSRFSWEATMKTSLFLLPLHQVRLLLFFVCSITTSDICSLKVNMGSLNILKIKAN